MTYEGTAWECDRGVCVVVRDLGRSDDGTSYTTILMLDHREYPEIVGSTMVVSDVEKFWRPL